MAASRCDIFGRAVDIGTPMSADGVRLIVGDLGEDMLVQQISTQYQQNVNRLWEVGSPKTYFIAGRTQGQLQIKRVLGPKNGVSQAFIKKYGNVCNIQSSQITLALVVSCLQNCDVNPNPQPAIKCSGVVLTSVGYAVSAVDMIINEDLTLLFARQDRNAA